MTKQEKSVREVYFGSDGGATRKLMTQLKRLGGLGPIAAQLFRAQKASSLAKDYRGGIRRSSGRRTSFRELSYNAKDKAMVSLCNMLAADAHGLKWGWKIDPKQSRNKHVLYVDLPSGQCSFHAPVRHVGPDYDGEWDGQRGSETRVIEFCESVLTPEVDSTDGVEWRQPC